VRGISTPRAPLVGAADSSVVEVLPLLFFISQCQRNTPQLSLCDICFSRHILVLGSEFKPLWACVSWARASHSLSTCDSHRKTIEEFVTLGGSPHTKKLKRVRIISSSGKVCCLVSEKKITKDSLRWKFMIQDYTYRGANAITYKFGLALLIWRT
jgi:hypothetical protein